MAIYIALGSNLNDPLKQLQMALQLLVVNQTVQVTQISSFYKSKPLSDVSQPHYINAVAQIQTHLKPYELLHFLQSIETSMGRDRGAARWSARIIDLDVLLYDNLIINDENLVIPHLGLTQREFVIYPLYEIAPNLILPGNESLQNLKNKCELNDLQKWEIV